MSQDKNIKIARLIGLEKKTREAKTQDELNFVVAKNLKEKGLKEIIITPEELFGKYTKEDIKGKTKTRKISLSPDTGKTDDSNETSKLLLMPGLEFFLGPLIHEANTRLKKKSSKSIKKGDQVEAKLKGWSKYYSG